MSYRPRKQPRRYWSGKRGEGETMKWIQAHVDYAGENCLFWPFSRGDGYGQAFFNGQSFRAHRLMCKLAHGEPPTPQHQAAHNCGTMGCLNPRHLSWKTNGENQLDRRRHGTKAMGWTNRGRSFGPPNSKFTPELDAELRRLAATMTQLQLAEHFGVTRSTIQYRLYGGSHKPRRDLLKKSS